MRPRGSTMVCQLGQQILKTMNENETNAQRLERMGVARVRLLLGAGGLHQSIMNDAVQWLARHDEEEFAAAKAFQIEQGRAVRSTLKASWIAAIASLVGVLIAIAIAAIPYLH
jgi:hypothetical protein